MGKGIYEGFRKPGDPMLGQTTIVIGGLRRTSKKRSKAGDEKKTENSPKKED